VAGSRRPALFALGLGGALALAIQLLMPIGAPLFDGVVVQEPYRYLAPAAGQAGSPTSFSSEPGLQAGSSRAFVASTSESPPQAQLIALAKAFVVPAGATTMKVTIEPVPPSAAPATGTIAGNVYRFGVVDEQGRSFRIAAVDRPTMTLRGPDGVTEATIGHLTSAGWQPLETLHGGGTGLFSTEPTEIGDYALLVGASAGPDLGVVAAAVVTVSVPVVVGIVLFLRRRRDRQRVERAAELARTRGRIPSKRRTPRTGGGSRS
jgi:hypothetical protein